MLGIWIGTAVGRDVSHAVGGDESKVLLRTTASVGSDGGVR